MNLSQEDYYTPQSQRGLLSPTYRQKSSSPTSTRGKNLHTSCSPSFSTQFSIILYLHYEIFIHLLTEYFFFANLSP